MSTAKDHPVIPLRAKAGYIATKRYRKDGRIVDAKDHLVVSEGMYSAKEMEHVMLKVAKEVGADDSQIRIDTYKQGCAPIEVNPRHRGVLPRSSRPQGPVKTAQPPYSRRLFTGMPQTPSEWAQHVADFEYNKEKHG